MYKLKQNLFYSVFNFKSIFIIGFICLCFFYFYRVSFASYSNGTINPSFKYAAVCHDIICGSALTATTVPYGIINFYPTGPASASSTNIFDISPSTAKISGIAWGNELGWIQLHPTSPSDPGLYVDIVSGKITGSAWSQVSGWINFSPTSTSTGVSITKDGEFLGWAWSGGLNGGWIHFDCSATSTCVKTDWKPQQGRPGAVILPPGSGGGTIVNSSLNLLYDVCLNIAGLQPSVPDGFIKDLGDFCLPEVDYCKNLVGRQLQVPDGFEVNSKGECIETKKSSPNKISEKIDVCPNLPGLQEKLPDDFVVDENYFCVPKLTDYCPNLSGQQTMVPDSMVLDSSGNCVFLTPKNEDIKPQEPPKNELNTQPMAISTDQAIIAFPFVKNSFRIPIKLPGILGAFLNKRNLNSSNATQLDLTSAAIATTGTFVVLWALAKIIGSKLASLTLAGEPGSINFLHLTIGLIAQSLMSLYWLLLLIFVPKWGIIFNAATGEPIANARVDIYNSKGKKIRTKYTNKKGKYCFRVLPGQFYMKTEIPNYQITPENNQEIKSPGTGHNNFYFGGKFAVKNPRKVKLDIPLTLIKI